MNRRPYEAPKVTELGDASLIVLAPADEDPAFIEAAKASGMRAFRCPECDRLVLTRDKSESCPKHRSAP